MRYPLMKLMDMCFWEIDYERDAAEAAASGPAQAEEVDTSLLLFALSAAETFRQSRSWRRGCSLTQCNGGPCHAVHLKDPMMGSVAERRGFGSPVPAFQRPPNAHSVPTPSFYSVTQRDIDNREVRNFANSVT